MKRTRRLYNELGLQLGNKTPKRRVKAKLRQERTDATRSNQVWAMDFVHDQLATGRKLRILTIIDTHSRFAPATDPRFSYRGEDVVQTLERVCRQVGYPKVIRVDNGSEFISRDLDLWAYQKDVVLDFSRPGKPTDNAYIESFNGKFRAECLNQHWFLTLDDARQKMEDWRRDYNEVRPHLAQAHPVRHEPIVREITQPGGPKWGSTSDPRRCHGYVGRNGGGASIECYASRTLATLSHEASEPEASSLTFNPIATA